MDVKRIKAVIWDITNKGEYMIVVYEDGTTEKTSDFERLKQFKKQLQDQASEKLR